MPRRIPPDSDPPALAKKPKPPVPLGNQNAFDLPGTSCKPFAVSYWDLWFAMLAAKHCGGDLDRLAPMLNRGTSFVSSRPESFERKISHLRDLQARLRAGGRTAEDIVVAAGDLARQEARRARSRILDETDREREWSMAMHQTPRQQRSRHALRGYWPDFPISPQADADELAPAFKTKRYFTEDQSFDLARRIDAAVGRAEKLIAARKHPQAQAMLRAILTVVINLMAVADDSYGSIGDSFGQAFKLYLHLPLAKTGIADAVFFGDLLTFLIWEDYGLTWNQTDGYFGRMSKPQTDWCIDFLHHEVVALAADGLDHHSDAALTLLGQIVAEQGRYDLFEKLAAQMGSREWHRVIQLADRAVVDGNEQLARRVFAAALTPGAHLEFLSKKYEQLKRGKWNPDPRA
jgi:hypothetical protein